ncbi:hypothetical protein JCM33374_g146 [Metschnikowia sp. JCM 33374]|nr:hypothetical protein JCM33374_g146 [Metschnikowia sp. JCM 33374]
MDPGSPMSAPIAADDTLKDHWVVDDENVHTHTHSGSPYSCTYCGLDCPSSAVKCGTCDKWFCNGKGTLPGSHIVTHLVQSKHNTVSLNESSPLGAETLECYNCGNKNVFMLGFVAAKQDSVVVVLCRIPCAHQRDMNWETNEWQPLIDGRSLLSWVAPVPPPDQMAETRPITSESIRKLEAQWRMNKDANISDIDHMEDPAENLLPVLLRYNDAATYHNSWVPLVEAEAECDKSLKESQALEHISLTWSMSSSGNHQAQFILSTYENNNLLVALGEELQLHYREFGSSEAENWSGMGRIVSLPSARSEFFTVELSRSVTPPPTHATVGFTVEFMWKGIPYARMLTAVKKFATDEKSVSAHLYHTILGHEVVDVEFNSDVPKNFSVPGLTVLNASQQKALQSAVRKPLSLIQGPPGTGKTVTSSAIIYYLTKYQKTRVLVCAPSNVAVDHLTQKLRSAGINAVRLYARTRENTDSPMLDHCSSTLASQRLSPKLQKLYSKYKLGFELSPKELTKLMGNLRVSEKDVLKDADVVCSTCIGAMDNRLFGTFSTVLIDESTQACELEALIPVVKGAKQLILVGDHHQLGPVIIDKRASKAGLSQSLFERLIALGHVPSRLEIQYRMNPALSEFPSNMFYEGSLQNGVTSEDRTWTRSTFPWPVPGSPMMFWVNYGKEEMSANGSSYLNRVEAMNVEKIISKLFLDGVRPDQIGVITPYEGQRAYIAHYMQLNTSIASKRAQYEEVEIQSVDAFQGREKDFIILSCVRANEDRSIGFLSDPRRLNVALTRAKYGMVVLGNPRSLSRNKLWNRLLVHYRERGCLVEGPLDNLQFSLVPLTELKEQNLVNKRNIRSTNRPFSIPDDMQSMLSYIPEDDDLIDSQAMAANNYEERTILDDTRWPQLSANQVSRLDALDVKYNHPVGGLSSGPAIQDDVTLQGIANAFSSALNI